MRARQGRDVSTFARLVAAILALGTWGSRPARAEGYYENEARVLGDHRFVPSSLVLWGFIDNAFAATSTAGATRVDADQRDLSARMASGRRLEFIEVAQSFSGSAAITPWLGLVARLSADGGIPRNPLSALVGGAHQSLAVEGGVALRLVRVGAFEVTARGDASWAKDKDLVPSQLPGPPLLEGHTTFVRPSLIIALGLTHALGLQASGSYAWRWFDVGDNDTVETLSGAAALTVAMAAVNLTLLVGGEISHDYGLDLRTVPAQLLLSPGGTQARGEVGLYYQGRRDLDLGAVFTYAHGDTNNARSYLGNIQIRYYF